MMGNFWTDLARHLADYERDEAEAEAEWWDEFYPGWRGLGDEPEWSTR